MHLIQSQYGKSEIGLLKVFRDGDLQSVQEIVVSVLVTGDFAGAFELGDNSKTVPTDTIKNTVYALAHDHLRLDGIEPFGLRLADHFLGKYPSFDGLEIRLESKPWGRMTLDGKPHPHAFQKTGDGTQTALICANRNGFREVNSGIKDLEILKSTGSGFVGFPRCEFTTLPEVTDRIMATRLTASWQFSNPSADFLDVASRVRSAFIDVFAQQYSRAVQETLFQMATLALGRCPELSQVEIRLPNLHYFPFDLSRFGQENDSVIFYPAPNPHGDISATVSR